MKKIKKIKFAVPKGQKIVSVVKSLAIYRVWLYIPYLIDQYEVFNLYIKKAPQPRIELGSSA